MRSKSTRLFIILAGFFIANALLAEVIGVKIFSLEDTLNIPRANIPILGNQFSFHLTAGVLLWPVVFVMTDTINEYYGPKGVKFLSYLTVGLISFSFFVYQAAIFLKPSEYFTIGNGIENPDDAFKGIFGQGLWIILGSVMAFFLSQVIDVVIFHRIKKITGEKGIWLRATGSTLVSQLIDSFVVLFIAFYIGTRVNASGNDFVWPFKLFIAVGIVNYVYKFIVAILMTPVIYLIHGMIEKYLGHEQAAEMKKAAMGDR